MTPPASILLALSLGHAPVNDPAPPLPAEPQPPVVQPQPDPPLLPNPLPDPCIGCGRG